MSSTVTVLGSTGSIGVSTLRVLKTLGGRFELYGLSCHRNISLLERQIGEFHPAVVAVGSEEAACGLEFEKLKRRHPDIEFLEGCDGILELARRDVDVVVSAIVGGAGLKPSLEALPHAGRMALANKETLVMAGDIFMRRVRDCNVELIPVDSEHSAVFALLENIKRKNIARIILTASGGSLRDRPVRELESVTPEEALAHPTWNMGSKITIDSATLVNKGLEVIEAHHLFNVGYDDIDVVIHPQSIIHSMVETLDGSVHALMSVPDMALPIMNALTYPEKVANPFGRIDFSRVGSLTFKSHEGGKYPALELCYSAGRAGGTMPAVLNGANEVAVGAFLEKRLRFTHIVKIMERVMALHSPLVDPGIDDIFSADAWARDMANRMIRG